MSRWAVAVLNGVERGPPSLGLLLKTSQRPAAALSRSALQARDALVLEHLPLADAIASVMARRMFPLVEREDQFRFTRFHGIEEGRGKGLGHSHRDSLHGHQTK